MLTTNPIYDYSRGRAQNSVYNGYVAPVSGDFLYPIHFGGAENKTPEREIISRDYRHVLSPRSLAGLGNLSKKVYNMNNQLVFKSHTLTPVIVNNQPFLGVSQIGTALNYADPTRLIKIYLSHADEFTPDMSFLTTVETSGGKQQARVFSLRGCHLLAMFSKTPVAKEFRRWVLDLIEQRNQTISKMETTTLDAKTLGGVVKRCAAAAVRDELETLPELIKAQVEQTVREVLSKVFYPGITEHPSGMPFGNWAASAVHAIGAMTSEYSSLKQKQQTVINLLQDKEQNND